MTLSPRFRFSAAAALFALALTLPIRADDMPLKFNDQWKFNPHAEYAGATGGVTTDSSSLKLAFDFSKGGSCVSAGLTFTDTVNQLSGIEVKVTGPGHFGVTISDATGQTFVYFIGVPGDSSPAFQIDLSQPRNVFGGAKDKKIHYPLKSISLMVSKSVDTPSGTEEITEVLLKAAPAPAPASQ
jgi:hypothetical protein